MAVSQLSRRRTFDPVQRVLHWWIGATVMALAALGWTERLMEVGVLKKSITDVHIVLGFALTVGFVLRVVWGIVGPKQARLSELWRAALSGVSRGKASSRASHELAYESVAATAYLLLYLAVACAVLSGLLLSGMRYDQGPFANSMFDELAWHEVVLSVHDISLYGATLFVLAHLTGMIRHESKSGVPVAQAMLSGYRYHRANRNKEEP